MKKYLLFFVITLTPVCVIASAAPADSLLRVLKLELSKRKVYDIRQEGNIAQLRKILNRRDTDLEQKYAATLGLFEAFKDYRFDSTFHYAQQLVHISGLLNNNRRLAEN